MTGARIRAARRLAGLSQEALSQRAGVSRDMIQNWETERTSMAVSALLDVAAALGVPPGSLLPSTEREPTIAEARAHALEAARILQQLAGDAS